MKHVVFVEYVHFNYILWAAKIAKVSFAKPAKRLIRGSSHQIRKFGAHARAAWSGKNDKSNYFDIVYNGIRMLIIHF